MENYILQNLKNGIEELRSEKNQQNKNNIAIRLIAFVEAELKKNDIKTELVHYKLWSGDISWELWEGQSPRGLRHEDKRPDMIQITSDKIFSLLTLGNHIKYLNELYHALELEDEKP